MGICVGIATRNAEKNLPDCLRSLAAQTVNPDEYVICIGPSDDKTEELIREFVKQTTVPIMVIYDRDGIGTGYARKAIVENSTQEYVAWADSDYIIPPNWIDAITRIIEKEKFDCLEYSIVSTTITFSEAMSMRRSGKLPDPIDVSHLERASLRTNSVMVVRCKAAIEVGNYDPYIPRGQGHDLGIRLESHGCKIVGYKGVYLYHVRRGISTRVALSNGVFLRFLYKYGLDYILHNRKCLVHAISFLIRSCVVFSFPLFGLCLVTGLPIIIPTLMFLAGAGGLVSGLMFVSSTHIFSLVYYIRQLSTCFGEWYTLYIILTTRNRPKRGYGKKFLRRG